MQRLLELGWVARGGLPVTAQTIRRGGRLRVAWIGGSITWAPGTAPPSDDHQVGYRDVATAALEGSLGVPIATINAACSGTGSDFAAFRIGRDALQAAPDLVVVEFAANDETIDPGNRVRGIEGTVRAALTAGADVCLVYTTTRDQIAILQSGRLPEPVRIHEQVADHYGVPSIYAALPVVHLLGSGSATWADVFVDHVHPSGLGHQHYGRAVADAIPRLLAATGSRALPPPIEPVGWWQGEVHDVQPTMANADWCYSTRERHGGWSCFAGVLKSTSSGSLRLAFHGRALGVLVEAGPDSGLLRWRVDGGPLHSLDLADDYTPHMVRPTYRILTSGDDLDDDWHVVEFSAAEAGDGRSTVTLGALLVS